MHFVIAIIHDKKENIEDLLETYNCNNDNHDGIWDWYVIGGRWQSMLKVKSGKQCIKGIPGTGCKKDNRKDWGDSCAIKDLDIEGYKKYYRTKAIRNFNIAHKNIKAFVENTEFMIENGIDCRQTKQEYIDDQSAWYFYRVMINGKWKELDDHKFGKLNPIEKEKYFINKYIKPNKNKYITIVDYHS